MIVFFFEAAALGGCQVDIATEAALHPMMREQALREAVPL